MRRDRLAASFVGFAAGIVALVGFTSCLSMSWKAAHPLTEKAAQAQAPQWSRDDLELFLHGSISTEVVPETVLRAFQKTYPDIYPTDDFSHIGAIPDPEFGWPIGFSRAKPAHLGGLSSVGINCAACHTNEVESASGSGKARVLGGVGLFDAEAFFASIVGSGFRTQDPANMKTFLKAYAKGTPAEFTFDAAWESQASKIAAAMAADPMAVKGTGPGGLHALNESDLWIDTGDLSKTAVAMLKLFHNERAALHVPDQIPTSAPPMSGPGRNDAFGLLSATLFNSPQPFAPVKYGLVWDVGNREHVHWDGNTRLPIARNLLAAIGLGAPMIDKHADLDFALIKRQTDNTEHIKAPKYPFAIDTAAAARGEPLYQANCIACHIGPEKDNRLYSAQEVGTDPVRASLFTQVQADKFNKFLAEVETPGYTPPSEPGIRTTGKYWSPGLAGVWARSPYLHNGSVRTMEQLLAPGSERPASFHRGTDKFDEISMGYLDEGRYLIDSKQPANSNQGHEYGTKLTPAQKHDLIEYLKTL